MGKMIPAIIFLSSFLPLQAAGQDAAPQKNLGAKAPTPTEKSKDSRTVSLQGEEFGFTTFTDMEKNFDELLGSGWDIVTLTPHARPRHHYFVATLQKDRDFALCRLLLADAAYMRLPQAIDPRVTGAFAKCFKLTK